MVAPGRDAGLGALDLDLVGLPRLDHGDGMFHRLHDLIGLIEELDDDGHGGGLELLTAGVHGSATDQVGHQPGRLAPGLEPGDLEAPGESDQLLRGFQEFLLVVHAAMGLGQHLEAVGAHRVDSDELLGHRNQTRPRLPGAVGQGRIGLRLVGESHGNRKIGVGQVVMGIPVEGEPGGDLLEGAGRLGILLRAEVANPDRHEVADVERVGIHGGEGVEEFLVERIRTVGHAGGAERLGERPFGVHVVGVPLEILAQHPGRLGVLFLADEHDREVLGGGVAILGVGGVLPGDLNGLGKVHGGAVGLTGIGVDDSQIHGNVRELPEEEMGLPEESERRISLLLVQKLDPGVGQGGPPILPVAVDVDFARRHQPHGAGEGAVGTIGIAQVKIGPSQVIPGRGIIGVFGRRLGELGVRLLKAGQLLGGVLFLRRLPQGLLAVVECLPPSLEHRAEGGLELGGLGIREPMALDLLGREGEGRECQQSAGQDSPDHSDSL